MDKLPSLIRDFKGTFRLYRETLEGKDAHPMKLRFIRTFESLFEEASSLMKHGAIFSQYGLLRGFCETVVMVECLLDHEQDGSLEHYQAYTELVERYFESLKRGENHAENDRPHQYDWFNAMKRGGFTTSKVSLKTLANDKNQPLLETFHILNVKIHNAEFFTNKLMDPSFKAYEQKELEASLVMIIDHLLRILSHRMRDASTKPLLDMLVEKRNHMKPLIESKEKAS
ncbi:MAG: hypothetical protein ACOCU5_01100 [Bacillota bacterium]